MTIQIDHVVIAGSDLTQLTARFEAIGLTPDLGGVHADGQTHNALIGFADGSYLELITPTPGNTAPKHNWSEFMNNDAGVCAWAIRSNNIQADAELYRSRGIPVSEPNTGGRTRPDGVRLEWISAKLGNETLGSVLPFLIQDVTPRERRVPFTKSTEGIITGVDKVLIDANKPLFDHIVKAFEISPGSSIEASNLPLEVDSSYQGTNPGVHGVMLNMADLDLARQRYHAGEKNTKWRAQNRAWPEMGPINLGFSQQV